MRLLKECIPEAAEVCLTDTAWVCTPTVGATCLTATVWLLGDDTCLIRSEGGGATNSFTTWDGCLLEGHGASKIFSLFLGEILPQSELSLGAPGNTGAKEYDTKITLHLVYRL